MEKYIKILENSNWLTSDEIKNFFTKDVISIMETCDRPRPDEIFHAFKDLTPNKIKVLIMGQDPYPDEKRAHGLAFSFRDGSISPNDSLKNIFDKIELELNIKNTYTNLDNWKKQGVLLLNTSLTLKLEADKQTQAKTQKNHCMLWKNFINHIINKLIDEKKKNNDPLVVMLWGRPANELKPFEYKNELNEIKYKEKYPNILILRSSHPSNLFQSCKRKIFGGAVPSFFESRPFMDCNSFLKNAGSGLINWQTVPTAK